MAKDTDVFAVGDTVYYYNSEKKGVVSKVTPITSNQYEVKWDDGSPTEVYEGRSLEPDPKSF